MPGPLTHRVIHPVRRKKASERTRLSAAGDAYVVGVYRDDNWDPENPGPSMPFVPLAALVFVLGDVFDGYRQQDDPAIVPLLTPHAGGGRDPSPLWVVHGRPAFYRACAALCGCDEWAIVLLLPTGPVPDGDECPVPEVVRMANVPHDPYVAVTSLRDGGAVEQGSVVVYQPSYSTAVWGQSIPQPLTPSRLSAGVQAKNSIALSVRGSSAANSSTRPHRSRATSSSRAHSKRMWPMSSLGPPQKIQVWAVTAAQVSFCLHRRKTCMVHKRMSRARSRFLCVGPWCTAPTGTASQALVRAANERHSISLTC